MPASLPLATAAGAFPLVGTSGAGTGEQSEHARWHAAEATTLMHRFNHPRAVRSGDIQCSQQLHLPACAAAVSTSGKRCSRVR